MTASLSAAPPDARPAVRSAPPAVAPDPGPLVVTVRDDAEIGTVLVPAAERAQVESRPVLVVLVAERAPWTTNALLNASTTRRVAQEVTARRRLVRALLTRSGVAVLDVVVVTEPFGITAAGRVAAVRRQVGAIAWRAGGELAVPAGVSL